MTREEKRDGKQFGKKEKITKFFVYFFPPI